MIAVLASALAAMATVIPQAASSYELLVAVAAPFTQCERGFDSRRAPLDEEYNSALGASNVRTDIIVGAPITVLNENALLALKALQDLSAEIDRSCDRVGRFSRFQAEVKNLHPYYSDREVAVFSQILFRNIEWQSAIEADFEAGRFKMPVPPMPAQSASPLPPRPKDNGLTNAPN